MSSKESFVFNPNAESLSWKPETRFIFLWLQRMGRNCNFPFEGSTLLTLLDTKILLLAWDVSTLSFLSSFNSLALLLRMVLENGEQLFVLWALTHTQVILKSWQRGVYRCKLESWLINISSNVAKESILSSFYLIPIQRSLLDETWCLWGSISAASKRIYC
jgi:hypothetical protein